MSLKVFITSSFIAFSFCAIAQDDIFDFTKSDTTLHDWQRLDKSMFLVDSASRAICRNDTLLALHYLHQYVENPIKNRFKDFIQYEMGPLFTKMQQIDSAKNVYEALLISDNKEDYRQNNVKQRCDFIEGLEGHRLSNGYKYNACLRLSELELKRNKVENAVEYLKLADKKYPAITSCANGYYLYKGQLNLRLAHCYLQLKDTTKAIEKLFNCILDDDGYPYKAIPILRKILYSRYTNKQVIKKIDKGIASLRKIKYYDAEQKEERVRTDIDLFGITIVWQMGGDGDSEDLKKSLRNDERLNDLKKAHYTLPQYFQKFESKQKE
jgi:tetratricopeptide (TPR) repeat protein